MTRCFFLCFILYSVNGFSQYDTSLIRKALEYIKTSQFRQELKEITEKEIKAEIANFPNKKLNNRYKAQVMAHMKFWLDNQCFAIDSFYYTPAHSTPIDNSKNNMMFRNFDTIPYKPYNANCNPASLLESFLLSSDVIELRHFSGTKARNIWFGETNLLRLEFAGDKPKILLQSYIIHN